MGIAFLFQSEQHLIVHCHDCRHEVRLTPLQAVVALGEACPFEEAARRLRCSKCGARGRDGRIAAYPCMADCYARNAVSQAERDLARNPGCGNARLNLEEALAAWDARRPADLDPQRKRPPGEPEGLASVVGHQPPMSS